MDEADLLARWQATLGGVLGGDPDVTRKPRMAATQPQPHRPPPPPPPPPPPAAATVPGHATAATLTALPPTSPATAPGHAAGDDPAARPDDPPLSVAAVELVEEIGRGGMGVVYRARQASLGREVALKSPLLAEDPVTRRRFLIEAVVTGRLDHPNIVPVYDIIRGPDRQPALAMKLIDGVPWRALIRPRTPAERERARRCDLDFHLGVLLAVANAVSFAHSRGLVHNDLKPDNVMVGDFGEVYVMDWGLAVDVRDPPPTDPPPAPPAAHPLADPPAAPDPTAGRLAGAVVDARVASSALELSAPRRSFITSPCGTPSYMPPELAEGRGDRIGPWTDVYLLGATLYEVLTERPPHQGATIEDVIRAAVRNDWEPLGAAVPAGLRAIVERAMAHACEARYADASAFREALAEFLKHRESLAIAQAAEAELLRSLDEAARLAGLAHEEAGSRTRLYTGFAEAVSGFRQAARLWSGNHAALAGARRARAAFAREALAHGDLGLAEAQAADLGVGDPDGVAIAAAIAEARAARKLAQANARRARRALAGALAAIGLGLLAFAGWASRERERQRALAEEAAARLAQIQRLADVKRLSDLDAVAGALYPAHPSRVEAMDAWLAEAGRLLERLPAHREHLARLEGRGRDDTAEWRWEHDTVVGLVAGLARLGDDTVRDVATRRAFASTVRARTIDDHREAWDRAIAEVADPARSPAYRGLRLAPQLGLIPLGRDPASGLEEFAHLESGEPARRGADGRLAIGPETGFVLVLLPGGTFAMGAAAPSAPGETGPGLDPYARASEGPVHEVRLDPFFIAKHEVTQGQWLRLAGDNPSAYRAGRVEGKREVTLLNPVEEVGWAECTAVLERRGLTLPTEAQWEYAARGGTTTVFWTGDDPRSLSGAVNIADRYCKENGGPGSWAYELWLDDGHVVHAPAGTFRPNPFGLHEVNGNVWEWCVDRYGPYTLPVRPGTGERLVEDGSVARVFRGGGLRASVVHARSADRYSLYGPNQRGFDIGVRAARLLDPADTR